MQTMQSGHGRLKLMGLVTAGVMLLVGIGLVEPSLAAWLSYLGYELTGAFLIVQAAVLGVVSLPRENGSLQSIAHVLSRLVFSFTGIGFGSLDLILAGSGVIEGQYVLLLLALPGALLWTNSIGETASDESDDDDEAVADNGKIVVTPDEGRPDPVGTLRSNAWSSAHTGLLIVAMAAILIPGTFLFRLLQRELIEGQPVGLGGLAEALSSLSGPVLWIALALGVVVPLVLLLVGAGTALSQWLVNRRYARAARDLTAEQVAFVERAYAALYAYATSRGYERWSIVTILLPLIAMFCVVFVYGFLGRDLFRSAALAYGPPGGDQSWRFVQTGSPASMVPGILFAIAGLWALHHAVCRIWHRYAEFVTWGTRTMETDGLNLRQALVRAVRIGRVRADATFSPAAFLRQLSGWNARYAYFFAALTGLPTLVLLERDMRNYQRFTDTYIDVVDYWSGEPQRIPYRDVVQVNLECFHKSKGGIDLEYEIELPGDRSIDLIDQADLPGLLADFDRIDRNLRAAGVRFSHNVRRPVGRPEFSAFSEECLAELTSGTDAATARRIEALLHLEEWRERAAAE